MQEDMEISWECLDTARVILEKESVTPENTKNLFEIYKLLSEHSEVNRNYETAIQDITKAINLFSDENKKSKEYITCIRKRGGCYKELYSQLKDGNYYDKSLNDYNELKGIIHNIMYELGGELNIHKDDKGNYNWEEFVELHTGKDFTPKEDELLSDILLDKAIDDDIKELSKVYEEINPFSTTNNNNNNENRIIFI